jgi:hypothetical protein
MIALGHWQIFIKAKRMPGFAARNLRLDLHTPSARDNTFSIFKRGKMADELPPERTTDIHCGQAIREPIREKRL